jgi:hypothetical protein
MVEKFEKKFLGTWYLVLGRSPKQADPVRRPQKSSASSIGYYIALLTQKRRTLLQTSFQPPPRVQPPFTALHTGETAWVH